MIVPRWGAKRTSGIQQRGNSVGSDASSRVEHSGDHWAITRLKYFAEGLVALSR